MLIYIHAYSSPPPTHTHAQHNCRECNRSATAAGGVIFRCLGCPYSCCYDHKPTTVIIVAADPRHEALGYPPTQQTCYVYCSAECQQFCLATRQQLPPPAGARYSIEA